MEGVHPSVGEVTRWVSWFLYEADHAAIGGHLDNAAFRGHRGPENRQGGDRRARAVSIDEDAKVEISEVVGVDHQEHVVVRDEIPIGIKGAGAAEQFRLMAEPDDRRRRPFAYARVDLGGQVMR